MADVCVRQKKVRTEAWSRDAGGRPGGEEGGKEGTPAGLDEPDVAVEQNRLESVEWEQTGNVQVTLWCTAAVYVLAYLCDLLAYQIYFSGVCTGY